MRIITASNLDAAKLALHERFFVELWHSMTHQLSLDSYRVKCMNARTIVRELSEELRIGRISDGELKPLCQEVRQVLDADQVIKAAFSINARVIVPFLAAPPVAGKDKQDKAARNATDAWRRFRFAAEDFSVALEHGYFRKVCEALPPAVKPANEAEIHALTGSLLSDLVDQGWPLESLFRWHTNFFPDDKDAAYTFEQNLGFMLRQLSRGKQPFRVTLRLSGTARLNKIEGFHDLKLSPEITITGTSDAEKRFATEHPNVTFATSTIDAVDATAGAISARASAEHLVDMLRFDYEHRLIEIEDVCYVRRVADGRVELPRIRHAVPNPRETVDEEDFTRFVTDLDRVAGKDRISESARRQLHAAIRQYRFGRDSEGYRDKFLNWWMGLEALSNVGYGRSIGESVTWNVSRAMMKRYFFRLLRDLLTTLKYIKIAWPADLAGITGCASLDTLSVSQLVTVLQSSAHATTLWNLCAVHPIVVFRGRLIEQAIADPAHTLQRLQQHLEHLEWHLNRLYRIRCCIVHGSPILFHLGLFAANLEFYLKETIRFVLSTFRDNDHIADLDELFHRATAACERVMAVMSDKSANQDTVREGIFMDVVVKGNPA